MKILEKFSDPVVSSALAARANIPMRMRYRITPPAITETSILASVAWQVGINKQDHPVSFYLKITIIGILLVSSILHRLF